MRRLLFLMFLGGYLLGFGQESPRLLQKRMLKVKDSIQLDSLSIQSFGFKLIDSKKQLVDTTKYHVDFSKALLLVKPEAKLTDSIQVTYYRYPSFLTKKYTGLDASLIIPKNEGLARLYKLNQSNYKNQFNLFEGLATSGSISRGITLGNNQNSVFNSELDLQISGKLSENVSLKASLQDSNIPIQEGGYSQSLDEFDQIFIELTGKNWGVRAGDIQLTEQQSVFAAFTKKLQGLSINTTFNGENTTTNAYASGALVRGVFSQSNFNGQEGNQGPYKLAGQNGELFVLIVSGSETVFVNGLQLKRGENNDYIIDYNAGEIRFNPTYPITSDMRIVIRYQTTQRNYARLFGLGGAKFTTKKWQLSGFVYSESDLKDQTLLEELSNPQKQVLSEAGDDRSLAVAPSALPDTFSENKVLYIIREGSEEDPIYDFSEDPDAILFQVRFTRTAQGEGDYILSNATRVNRIFEFVGVGQGDFLPVTQLDAPNKLQIGVLMGSYAPTKKTNINFELAASDNDLNLFSGVDDENNKGGAIRVKLQQQLFQKDSISWNASAFGSVDWVHENYRTVEALYNIEFNRDWNLVPGSSNQLLTKAGLQFIHPTKGAVSYALEYLDFDEQYSGSRHILNAQLKLKKWQIAHNSSLLNSSNIDLESNFLRSYTAATYGAKKTWFGGKWGLENNEESQKIDRKLTANSQRYQSYEVFTGVGDSTSVFAKLGYRYRVNDSIQKEQLQRVSTSNTVYLNSKLIDNTSSQLSLFVNYRVQSDVRETAKDKNLNTRLVYRQKLWNNRIQWNSLFETQSGSFLQQEFTYVEVDAGRGLYTWNDYNEDGVQDLQEFELSLFPDQATYIRVLLPRQGFVRTYQNRLSQQLNFSFDTWSESSYKWQRLASHFYNQISYTIDRRVLRQDDNIKLNLFKDSEDDLGLNLSFRNTLFFNRGKQRYTSSYTYLETASKNVLVTGRQSNEVKAHQLSFTHKVKESWLLDFEYENNNTKSEVADFSARDYEILTNRATPKVSYLFSDQTSFSLAYSLVDKNNIGASAEQLKQQRFTTSLRYASKQNTTITSSFDWFENEFTGDAFTPVAFQILEGLQPGTNFTWSLLAQKKLTKFLELNLDYSGRKSKDSKTIHTGSMQLRAFF